MQIIATRLASYESDHVKCTDKRKGVNRAVEQSGGESFAAANDESDQTVTGMRDGRVSKQAAHIFLRESDEVA